VKSRTEKGENVSRKPKPTLDDPEESARFVETAKAIGSDEHAFNVALDVVVPPKRKPQKETVRGTKGPKRLRS